MPKPVLSDSLFNADDVATAILNEANLQIANNSLGVTDITDKFTVQSGVLTSTNDNLCIHFMGIVFVNLYAQYTSTSPSVDLFQISDSNFYPVTNSATSNISYQGDYVGAIRILTSGMMKAFDSEQPSGSDSTQRLNINMWYKTV